MAIIALDLDGTLITCEPRQSAVLRAACIRNGICADVAAVWRLKRSGKSTLQALEILGTPTPLASKVAADWIAMIEEPQWLALDSAFPGTHPWLTAVKESGHQLQLITARRRAEFLRPELRNLGLESFFSWIHCVSEGAVSSAKANHLQHSGARLFIGDSESDALAAKYAGCPFAAVSTGQLSEEFLQGAVGAGIHPSLDRIAW